MSNAFALGLAVVLVIGLVTAAAASRKALAKVADYVNWRAHKLEKARRQPHRRPAKECVHLSIAVLSVCENADSIVHHIRALECARCLDVLFLLYREHGAELEKAADVPAFWAESHARDHRLDLSTRTLVTVDYEGDWPIMRGITHLLNDGTGDGEAFLETFA